MLLIVLKIWGKDSGHKRKATSDSTSHGRPRRGVRGAPSGVAHAVVVPPLSVCASPAIALLPTSRQRPPTRCAEGPLLPGAGLSLAAGSVPEG